MLKKSLLCTVVLLLVLGLCIPVVGAASSDSKDGDPEEIIITPMWTYLSAVSNGLELNSSGKASMVSTINTYSSIDRVNMTNNLQRYQNGTWTTVQAWSQSAYDTYDLWTKTYYVNQGYSYRLKTYFYAYIGSTLVESTTLTSPTRSY